MNHSVVKFDISKKNKIDLKNVELKELTKFCEL